MKKTKNPVQQVADKIFEAVKQLDALTTNTVELENPLLVMILREVKRDAVKLEGRLSQISQTIRKQRRITI